MKRPLARRLFFWVRVAVLAVVVVMLVHISVRYDLERLPDHVVELEGEVAPGALMVLSMIDESTVIGHGTLVEVVLDTKQGRRRLFSQVRGVPGQIIALRAGASGGREIFVDGASTWHTAPLSTPLVEGEIPGGCYLLLDPAAGTDGADSRRLGLIERSRLRRKILYSL